MLGGARTVGLGLGLGLGLEEGGEKKRGGEVG